MALIISVISLALMIIFIGFDKVSPWIIYPGIFLILFLFCFLLIYYTVDNFIFDKINPIYKTIENIPLTRKELRRKLEGKDMIQEVNSLVINYAQNRTKEIKKLRRLEKYRKEFLGNVSHELKTPIFNIQGYILTLLDGGLEDPEINREYLERTEASINRMINIIEDLEAIARLETGELQLELGNFDIVQTTRDIYNLQDMNARKYGISLEFDKNYDRPILVWADKKRIMEALNNLISNSIIH